MIELTGLSSRRLGEGRGYNIVISARALLLAELKPRWGVSRQADAGCLPVSARVRVRVFGTSEQKQLNAGGCVRSPFR